jgi:two-component system, OmpR family, sensor histidine kinase ChvG
MTLTSDFSTADPSGRDTPRSEVVLGEDWEKPEIVVEQELRAARDRRSVFALNRSPLARKIILFNLLGIVVLVRGSSTSTRFVTALCCSASVRLPSKRSSLPMS